MFDFNKDSGTGNLNVRAYLASIVGPRRVASGRRAVKPIVSSDSKEIAKNGAEVEAMYIEAWLPQKVLAGLPGLGAFISFAIAAESTGENGQQLLLSATQRYSGIILPNEQLYAAVITDALGGPIAGKVNLVVSTVVF